MRFEQALQAMRIGKVVYNKQEPNISYGIDNLENSKALWYGCGSLRYYFRDFIGFHQKEILSEDWEVQDD